MVEVTVFLVRHGESLDEVTVDEDDTDEEPPPPLRLAQKVDPPLSMNGHLQAAVVLTRFLKALVNKTPDDSVRKMAVFSAPFRSCTGTAIMMSCAGLHAQTKLRWRYSTILAAESPTAIPIVVVNGLCNQAPEIDRLGGGKAVVNAGLLHCAAEPFNDARGKCPMMKVMAHEWKALCKDPVKEWKNERGIDEIRRVIDVQYLRIDDPNDPWSLKDMTPQVNLIVGLVEPKRFLTPPRKGGFEKKTGSNQALKKELEIGPDIFVKESIIKARQTGCDTIVMFVTSQTMLKILNDTNFNANGLEPEASSIATVIAGVSDDDEPNVWFRTHGYFPSDEIMSDPENVIPDKWTGPVNVVIEPPEGQDPDSVPPNQWSKFPPPQPEVIPEDYPDLYVFILCKQNSFSRVVDIQK